MLLLCIKIFLARILDVSLGTFRTILTVKGKSVYASIIGFIEVLIWFLVVQEAMNTTQDGIFIAISYALGFSTGTYLGGFLSKRIIPGNLGVQIITNNKNNKLVDELRNSGYAVSVLNVQGKHDENILLFVEIDKKNYNHLQNIVRKYDKKAFVVATETKIVQNGFIK